MNGDQAIGVTGVAMALTLVGSGLIARRLPARRTLGMALLWAGIFGAAFAIASMLR